MLLKIAHRGASAYEPENTLRAFQKAIELNADMIELDVHLCKTGEVIVIHDPTLRRTTNGKGFIKKKTLAEIKSLHSLRNEPIPTLPETLDCINRRAKVNIEIKNKKAVIPVLKIIDEYVLGKGWEYEDFLISSFLYPALQHVRKLNTHLKVGILWNRVPLLWLKKVQAIHAYSLHLPHRKINAKLILKAHQQNIKVIAWTVNRPKNIAKMKELKVDRIISNYPDKI